jgi:hypothetical protein
LALGIAGAPVAPFCGAYIFEFGIVAFVVVPGAVAGGIPGVVVEVGAVPVGVVAVVEVPDVVVALVVPGAAVAANAAPPPIAARTTAKAAFLAAMFM